MSNQPLRYNDSFVSDVIPASKINLLDTAPLSRLMERGLVPAAGQTAYLHSKCGCQYSSTVKATIAQGGQIFVVVHQLRIHPERSCNALEPGERGYIAAVKEHNKHSGLLDELCKNGGILTLPFMDGSYQRHIISKGPHAGEICWRIK